MASLMLHSARKMLNSNLLKGTVSNQAMMGTIAAKTFGNPSEVLTLSKGDTLLTPAAGEVKITMKASSVLVEDIYSIQGSSLNMKRAVGTMGTAGSGTVSVVGADDVSGLAVNDTVLVIHSGLWADEAVVPTSSVCKLPDMKPEEAASMPAYLSAWAILNNYCKTPLKSGDLVVQTNGEGAVGTAITMLGKAMGLNLISLTSNELASAKLSEAIKSKGPVKLAVVGQSGDHVTNMMRSLSPGSTLVSYNGTVEPLYALNPVSLPISGMIFQDVSMSGFDLNTWVSTDSAGYHSAVNSLLAFMKDKKLKSIPTFKTYPQKDFMKAIAEVSQTGTAAVLKH